MTGTAIGVAGLALTVPGVGPPSVEFSLDGKVKDIATAPMNGTMKDKYPYFSIEDLDGSVEHSLEIRVLNATQQYPFILDAILYVPSNRGALPATQSFLTTVLPTQTGASTDSTVTKSSSVPVGPIVGGVIGGLALLLATSIAVWHLCFRAAQVHWPAVLLRNVCRSRRLAQTWFVLSLPRGVRVFFFLPPLQS